MAVCTVRRVKLTKRGVGACRRGVKAGWCSDDETASWEDGVLQYCVGESLHLRLPRHVMSLFVARRPIGALASSSATRRLGLQLIGARGRGKKGRSES